MVGGGINNITSSSGKSNTAEHAIFESIDESKDESNPQMNQQPMQLFGGIGLGVDHLKPSLQQSSNNDV